MRNLAMLQRDADRRTYQDNTHSANIKWRSRRVKSKQPQGKTHLSKTTFTRFRRFATLYPYE